MEMKDVFGERGLAGDWARRCRRVSFITSVKLLSLLPHLECLFISQESGAQADGHWQHAEKKSVGKRR